MRRDGERRGGAWGGAAVTGRWTRRDLLESEQHKVFSVCRLTARRLWVQFPSLRPVCVELHVFLASPMILSRFSGQKHACGHGWMNNIHLSIQCPLKKTAASGEEEEEIRKRRSSSSVDLDLQAADTAELRGAAGGGEEEGEERA